MTAGKEETRELTTHAGLDEHRHRVVLVKDGSLNQGNPILYKIGTIIQSP